MAPRILLVGYYSAGNTGDEWLKEKSTRLIQTHIPNAYILFHNAKKKAKTLWLIRSVDQVIFGGGSIFQDQSSVWSLFYYLTIVALAKAYKKPVRCIGQGLEPLSSILGIGATRLLLKSIQKMSLRDTLSDHVAKKIYKLPENSIINSVDLAYYSAKITPTNDKNSQYIGIALKPHPTTPELVKALKKIPKTYLGLTSHTDQDGPLHLQAHHHLDMPKNIALKPLALTQKPLKPAIHCLISMRYHACVWASLNQIPFIAIGIHPKIVQLAKTLKQPLIHPQNISHLPSVYQEVQSHYPSYENALKTITPKLIKQAQKHDLVFKK